MGQKTSQIAMPERPIPPKHLVAKSPPFPGGLGANFARRNWARAYSKLVLFTCATASQHFHRTARRGISPQKRITRRPGAEVRKLGVGGFSMIWHVTALAGAESHKCASAQRKLSSRPIVL